MTWQRRTAGRAGAGLLVGDSEGEAAAGGQHKETHMQQQETNPGSSCAAAVEADMGQGAVGTDTILIIEDRGEPVHRFCRQDEARRALLKAGIGSMITSPGRVNVQRDYEHSPELRARVEAAKDKLRAELKLHAAMDRHGIPADPGLRHQIVALVDDFAGK